MINGLELFIVRILIYILTEKTTMPTVMFKAMTPLDFKPNHEQIIFIDTLFNYGVGYDNNTGVFTAPVAGNYLFTGQLCSRAGGNIHSGIVVDGKDITRTHSHNRYAHVCSSFDAIVMLHKSGKVWIQSYSRADELYTNSHHWNTFTGVLLNN